MFSMIQFVQVSPVYPTCSRGRLWTDKRCVCDVFFSGHAVDCRLGISQSRAKPGSGIHVIVVQRAVLPILTLKPFYRFGSLFFQLSSASSTSGLCMHFSYCISTAPFCALLFGFLDLTGSRGPHVVHTQKQPLPHRSKITEYQRPNSLLNTTPRLPRICLAFTSSLPNLKSTRQSCQDHTRAR